MELFNTELFDNDNTDDVKDETEFTVPEENCANVRSRCLRTRREIPDGQLERLKEISLQAYNDAAHALLFGFSEHSPTRPPLAAIRRFVQKVLAVEQTYTGPQALLMVEQARTDRLDPDTEQVQKASAKVIREFDRLRGLLRFSPVSPAGAKSTANESPHGSPLDTDFRYTARCTPDHFVLPLLSDHFAERFGKVSWAIIDEKRNLVLLSAYGKKPELYPIKPAEKKRGTAAEHNSTADEWEYLWRNYHRSINNEDRSNPQLQKQFMPLRYWKYLPELNR